MTETFLDDKGNLLKLRTKLNDTDWAETQYTYADVTVGTKTYHGAMTEEKKLVTGTPETGTWAVTDLDSGGYWANGQPKQTVAIGVAKEDGGTPVDLTTSMTVDAFGNILTKTDSTGVVTQTNTYDVAGRLLTSTGAQFTATVGTPTATQIVAHHSYDPWGHETESYVTSTNDPSGTKANWTTTVFDRSGRASLAKRWLFTSPPPSGTPQSTTSVTYDGLGRQISSDNTTVSGLAALSAYDARGNVVVSWAEGACSGSYSLTNAARVLDASNNPAYDALGRKQRSAGPGDGFTTYTYTDDNRLLRQTNPDGTWAQSTYDAAGNVIATLNSNNATTSASYDEGGRCESSTNGNGFVTDFTYDLLGRCLTAGPDADNTSVSTSHFTYNTLGWKLKIVDADGFTSEVAG